MASVNSPVEAYTDGACKNNPGPGGMAYVIVSEYEHDNNETTQDIIEYAESYRRTTNNRMEILAVIKAMEKVAELVKTNKDWEYVSQLNIYTDSEYVANSISKKWVDAWSRNNWVTKTTGQTTKNRDLWEKFLNTKGLLTALNVALIVSWIKGHVDNEYNNKADKLAVEASEREDKLIDKFYENNKSNNYN